MVSSRASAYLEPGQMHGVPGTIYVLENTGLRPGVYKIGLTRRSGWAKAIELNRDAQNIIPGNFECVFERRARNCGGVLDEVIRQLHFCQRGKRTQHFFELELGRLQELISATISHSDQQSRTREYQEQALREYLEEERQQNAAPPEADEAPPGLFKKACLWMAAVAS